MMTMFRVPSRRLAHFTPKNFARAACGFALASLPLGLLLLPQSGPSGSALAAKAGEPWPAAVQARYRLKYNGIEVGRLTLKSDMSGSGYAISGSGKVSVLFGAFSWKGSSNVSGRIEGGKPAPETFGFEYKQNKKGGTVNIGFKDRVPADIAVDPPAKQRADTVPLTPAHLAGALDPMSAILMLTKADGRPPCDRRAGIFDGKRRYDIVFTPKRTMQLPAPGGNGAMETAHVCRATYEPIAGHRDNADTKAYAANRDVEIVLRRIASSDMLIPYSVTIPTSWGTGTMVTDRIDVVTATAGKVAFTN
jgi:hypothetical protein